MNKSPLVYLNKIPLPILAVDEVNTITWISQHFREHYNLNARDIIGKNIDSIFKIKTNNQLVPISSVKRFSQILEVNLLKITTLGWFKIQRIPMKTNKFQELILFSDVSEYINDIQERVNSELNYHTIFQNAPYSNILLRLDGSVIDCNQETSKIFELPIEEMIGKSYADLINISSDLYKFYEDLAEQIRNGEEATPFPTEIDTLKGNHKILEVFPYLIRRNNQPHSIHLIIHDLTEEKKTAQKLSESITVFAAFMENFSGVAFIKSPEGKFIYFNKTLLNLINQNPSHLLTYEECIGKTDFDLFTEEDAKIFRKNDLQVLSTQTATQMTETTNVNGILRYWFVNKFIIANEGETPWAVAGMGVDITDQKESEFTLKIQRDFGISLIDVVDPDELFKLCVDTAMKIPEVDLIGVYLLNNKTHNFELTYSEGATPDFIEKVKTNQFRSKSGSILENKKPVYRNVDFIKNYSKEAIIEQGIKSYCVIPILIENQIIGAFNVASKNYKEISRQSGNVLELISSQLGTTLAKLSAQDKIKLNEIRLKTLLKLNQMKYESENEIYNFALENGVRLTKSTHGFIAHVDPESHTITRIRIWSIHAKHMPPINELTDENSNVITKEIWDEIVKSQKPMIVNDKSDMGGHKLFPSSPREIYRYMTVPIFVRDQLFAVAGLWNKEENYEDSDVNQLTLLIEAVVTLIRKKQDDEQREFYRKEIEKAEKINALGILAGGIAHDFNNILTAVLGNISLAEMSGKDESQKRLNEAKKAILRSKELTQQLLTFSKGGTPIKKLSSIGLLLRETADFVVRGSNVKIAYDIPENLWAVEIDEGQISQVINNLVLNAIQAMPNGGTLYIQSNNKVIRADSKIPIIPGKYIAFSVQDEGVGIPKKYIDQIFDPYFTTKEKGSGLGLATCYAIITKHGGSITVKSKVGIGSTFNIFIPAISDKQPKETINMNNDLIYGSGKILVMDDEEIIRKVAKRMLEKLGYTVTTTIDGEDTIEQYENAIKAHNPFDLVILDLTIPGGMGGKETILKLKKHNPNVKAIVSSGYSVDPIMSDFKKYGFSGIIAKPWKFEDFGEIIHSVLNDK